VAYTNAAAGSVADLMSKRESLPEGGPRDDRTAGIVVADHEYVEKIIDTLPDKYARWPAGHVRDSSASTSAMSC